MIQNTIANKYCDYGTCANTPLVKCPDCGDSFCGSHFSGSYDKCIECRLDSYDRAEASL